MPCRSLAPRGCRWPGAGACALSAASSDYPLRDVYKRQNTGSAHTLVWLDSLFYAAAHNMVETCLLGVWPSNPHGMVPVCEGPCLT